MCRSFRGMTPETLIAQEDQRREDLARRYQEIPGDRRNRITHVAKVCLAIELDEQLQHGSTGPPGETSQRIMELTGLTQTEVVRAISSSTDSTKNDDTYLERAKDEEGYKLAVTEAGRSLVDREVALVVQGAH